MKTERSNGSHKRAVGEHERNMASKNKEEFKSLHQFSVKFIGNSSSSPQAGMSLPQFLTLGLLATTLFPIASSSPVTSHPSGSSSNSPNATNNSVLAAMNSTAPATTTTTTTAAALQSHNITTKPDVPIISDQVVRRRTPQQQHQQQRARTSRLKRDVKDPTERKPDVQYPTGRKQGTGGLIKCIELGAEGGRTYITNQCKEPHSLDVVLKSDKECGELYVFNLRSNDKRNLPRVVSSVVCQGEEAISQVKVKETKSETASPAKLVKDCVTVQKTLDAVVPVQNTCPEIVVLNFGPDCPETAPKYVHPNTFGKFKLESEAVAKRCLEGSSVSFVEFATETETHRPLAEERFETALSKGLRFCEKTEDIACVDQMITAANDTSDLSRSNQAKDYIKNSPTFLEAAKQQRKHATQNVRFVKALHEAPK